MNCTETRKYLSAFLDSELDTRTNIEVLEHVEMCPRCAGRLEAQGRLRRAVSAYVRRAKAPASLRARVEGALVAEEARRRRVRETVLRFATKGWVRAFAAAASILLVFTLVYNGLLAPTSALNNAAIREHVAVLRDQVPTFLYTGDATRAQRLALFRMEEKPSVPLMDREQFQLVGAGPSEIELRNVGHFVFRYKVETVSMFVFEGMNLDSVGGKTVGTGLGTVKVDESRGVSLVAWQGGRFTYILVSRLPAEDLLEEVGPRIVAD